MSKADPSGIVKAMVSLAELPEIFKAAQRLESAGLLKDETAAGVVKRYVAKHPEIQAAIDRAGAKA